MAQAEYTVLSSAHGIVTKIDYSFGHKTKEMKTCFHIKMYQSIFSSLLCNIPKGETTPNPIEGDWINKLVYSHSGTPVGTT